MWHDRDLTAEEGAAQLQLDLRLAAPARLHLRPAEVRRHLAGQLDPHPIWQESVERSLDLAAELDVVICPEIHAPTPIKHPVTQGYLDFIERDRHRALQAADRHRHLPDRAGPRRLTEEIEVERGRGACPAHLRPLAVPMADLVEVLPHVHFIQAKFFEIDDDLHDLHVPWDQIIPTLQDAGWSGWLSSEYEGRREPYRGRDQVRRQHALLRTLEQR